MNALWALIAKHPGVVIRSVVVAALLGFCGFQMLRAERAERHAAEAETRATADHWQLTVCQDDRVSQQAREALQVDALIKAQEAQTAAEKRAKRVKIRTVEIVREIQAEPIPQECTAAIEYLATEGAELARGWDGTQ